MTDRHATRAIERLRGPVRRCAGGGCPRRQQYGDRPMTRILLVRHGESEWNAAGRWQGQADPSLTERGRQQAAHAAGAIGTIDAIVASDLERALVTAQIIAGELGLDPVYVDEDLRERDAGEWSGLTRAEIHAQWPGFLADDSAATVGRVSRAGDRRPPGWESDDHLWERVHRALLGIAAMTSDGDVLAVTHGGVVYVTEEHLGDPGGRLANLGGRWVEVDGERITLGDRVVLIAPQETVAIERDRI